MSDPTPDLSNGLPPSITAPPGSFKAVAPSDTNDLPGGVCRGIYIGGTGDVTCIGQFAGGPSVTFTSMLGGLDYPRRISRVLASGTTATGIVALY